MHFRLFVLTMMLVANQAAFGKETSTIFGSWRVANDGDYSEAFTASDTGATFGLICSRSKTTCSYFVESPITCGDGATIPILMNGDTGSDVVTGACHTLGSGPKLIHALILTPTNSVDTLVAKGGNLGFAMPMVSGQFSVFRFTLDGSVPAIERTRSYASHTTGDQVL